jgi:hypothetical protein
MLFLGGIFLAFMILRYVFAAAEASAHKIPCNEKREPHAWAWRADLRGFEKLTCDKCGMTFGED